jgi:transcriptional regulator with PAS, ATPase and Fis domain
LNALQSRQIVRVGDNRPIPVDIRLICATNRNLLEAVEKGEFRQDLLYRIDTIQVQLPPLRERREDIPLLAEFFLAKYAHKYRKEGIRLDDSALKKLSEYVWPGNIRELQHTLERAVILSDTALLRAADFPLTASKAPDTGGKRLTLDEAEEFCIQKALQRNHHNLSVAAAELGISRPTLYNKMKKYGFESA